MSYHDTFADALDRIGTIKPDAELTMISGALVNAIVLASADNGAVVYRPATFDAVKLARQAHRHVLALIGREDMRRLMEQARQRTDRPRGIPTAEDTRMILGRSHVTD